MKPVLGKIVAIVIALGIPATGLCSPDEAWDPIEPVNRGVFWFNDKADHYVIEPVARGYKDTVPKPVQTGVGNFFANLRYPSYLVNDLLQLKFCQAADHTGRFLINSTVGLLGVLDVAKEHGLPDHYEDFGITLAYYDVPPGPYLVLPFLGPSNARDGVGLVVDTVLNPMYWINFSNASSETQWIVSGTTSVIKFVDIRAGLIDAVDTAKESSLDYYLFVQSAYYQYRRGVLYDGNPPDDDEESVQESSKLFDDSK